MNVDKSLATGTTPTTNSAPGVLASSTTAAGPGVPQPARCRAAVRTATLALLASVLGSALSQAAPNDGNADVVFGAVIGVDELPAGIQGGANEINHARDFNDPSASQALVVDFGGPVTNVSAVLDSFLVSEGGNNCTEVGRWSAFDVAGVLIGSATFAAGTGPAVITSEPLRFVAFSAEPYANGCLSTTQTPDTSDYTITSISFTTPGGDLTITGNNLSPLVEADFLAYDTDEPFVQNGLLIDPDGNILVEDVFVVDDDVCVNGTGDGTGTNDTGCTINVDGTLSITFPADGDIAGTLELANPDMTIIADPRAACALEPPEGALPEALVLDGANGLPAYPSTTPGEFLTIPPYLCGIPNADTGQPEFVLLNLISDLTVARSVLFHEVEDPDNTDYFCQLPAAIAGAADPGLALSRQPVFGWSPRPGEIPVIDGNGNDVSVMEDLTNGCGSYRGGTGRASYLLYALAHLQGSDYVAITREEILQLESTLALSQPCVNDDELQSALSSHVKKILTWFDRGDRDQYSRARKETLVFRNILENEIEVAADFPACYYDATQSPSIVFVPEGQEPGLGQVPRNFRGDLLSQTDHIIYMLDTFLGATSDKLPPNGK